MSHAATRLLVLMGRDRRTDQDAARGSKIPLKDYRLIKSGLRNPTLATVEKILDGMGRCFADLDEPSGGTDD